MNPAYERKIVSVIQPAAIIDNASATTAVVDTLGWDYAVFDIQLGATDIALTALKLQESDALNGSDLDSGADVSGTVFGTSVNDTGSASTLPSATDDNKLYAFFVDLRGRKRYLDLVATVGDGSSGGYLAATCSLFRGSVSPSSAATAGYAQRIIV